jgi:hypothetical protein
MDVYSDTIYGIKGEDKIRFCNAYTDLSYCLLVWPSPSEMRLSGTKHEWIRQLDRIAKSQGNPRPITLSLREGCTVPTNGTWVLKREFSENCQHVEIVDFLDSVTRKKNLQRVWKDTRYLWVLQTYVPLLERWGEWRVFLIGGKVRYIVQTTKVHGRERDKWDWNKVNAMFTLSRLTSVHISSTH